MRNLVFACLMAITLASPALAQEARPAVRMSKMFPMLETYLALPPQQRTHFDVAYAIHASDPSMQDFDLWIEPDGRRVEIPRDETGQVILEGFVDYAGVNPMVMTNLPKGGGAMSVTARPRLDLQADIPVADIELAIDQANAAMRKKAGIMSFAAPSVRDVIFDLAPGTSAVLHYPDGRAETLSTPDETLKIRPQRSNDGARLAFSQPPLDAAFTD